MSQLILTARVVSCLAIGTVLAAAPAIATSKNSEAEKLLERAEQMTDIRSAGSSPFHLAARLRTYDEKGVATDGSYDLHWKSPGIWRDEIKMPGFVQTRVAATDRIYILREPRWLPLEVYNLRKLLEFPRSIRWSSEAVGTKVREKTKGTQRELSIEIRYEGDPWKRLFLNPDSGLPIRVEYIGERVEHHFDDFAEFGGHFFPRVLTEIESKRPIMEVRLTELATEDPNGANFVAPEGAGWMRWCPDIIPAKPSKRDEAFALPSGIHGDALRRHVTIDGIIGPDGQWENLVVVKSAGKEIDEMWLSMLRRQRYFPARCGDTPVEQEMVQDLWLQ